MWGPAKPCTETFETSNESWVITCEGKTVAIPHTHFDLVRRIVYSELIDEAADNLHERPEWEQRKYLIRNIVT